MIGGNLDLYCPVAAGALPHIEAKAIKFFGVLTDQRSPLLPHLPTAAEQGLPASKATTGSASLHRPERRSRLRRS